MILEQITQEVSNRSFSSHNFNEISNSLSLVAEAKKPELLKKTKKKSLKKLENKTKKNKTLIEQAFQEKIKKLLSKKNKKLTSKNKSKKTKKDEDIDDILEIKEELDELKNLYGQMEAEYNLANIDYASLFSYLEHKAGEDLDYGAKNDLSSPLSLVISDEVAEETIQKIQVSYLVGNSDEVSHREKEKLNNWIVFNQALRSLYEVLSPIKNKNIDYAKIN